MGAWAYEEAKNVRITMGAWAVIGDLRDAIVEVRAARQTSDDHRRASAERGLNVAREVFERELVAHPEWFGVTGR
jgi:hypothetical protein